MPLADTVPYFTHRNYPPPRRRIEAASSNLAQSQISKAPPEDQNLNVKCSMKNGRSIVDQRLRRRALLAAVMASAILAGYIAAVQLDSQMLRTAMVVLMPPLFYLTMACISPAATLDDLNPVLEWCMLYGATIAALATFGLWAYRCPDRSYCSATHPCGSLVTIPTLFACLARMCVPLLGTYNAMWFWPAERFVLITLSGLRVAVVAAQANAKLLAEAAAALGFSELLPMPVAVQCQAHTVFLPVGISLPMALVFSCTMLLIGFVLTPSMRTRLARLSGRLGLPAARVLHLNDGISLEPDEQELNAAFCVSARSAGCSGGTMHKRRRPPREEHSPPRDLAQLAPQMKQTVRDPFRLNRPVAQTHEPHGGNSCSCESDGTDSELGRAFHDSNGDTAANLLAEEPDQARLAVESARPNRPFDTASSVGSSIGTAATEANINLSCVKDIKTRYNLPFDLAALPVYAPIPQFGASVAELTGRTVAVLSEADRAKLLVSVDSNGCLVYASSGKPIVASLPPHESMQACIFVALSSGAIYMYADDGTIFHHALASNAPVVAAGEMTFSDGRLLSISNRSGHYRPAHECLRVVVSLLRSKGAQIIVPFKEYHYDGRGQRPAGNF